MYLHINRISCDIIWQFMHMEPVASSLGDFVKAGKFPLFYQLHPSILGVTYFIFYFHSLSWESFSHQFLGILSSFWISSPFLPSQLLGLDNGMRIMPKQRHGLRTLFSNFQCCQKFFYTPYVSPSFESQEQLIQTLLLSSTQPQQFCQQVTFFTSQKIQKTIGMQHHQFLSKCQAGSHLRSFEPAVLLTWITLLPDIHLANPLFFLMSLLIVTFSIRLALLKLSFHPSHRHPLFLIHVQAQ